MDKNEITTLIDVKLDIADKSNEARRLRSWTKCNVRIEAIKSFPCLLQLIFKRQTDETEIVGNLCVSIHVPGVQIVLTNSRSKKYSYGLTWKHNRKRCQIFLAFEQESSFQKHMKWLKESLKNLELHRLEIIETKRKSRDGSNFLNARNSFIKSSNIKWTPEKKKLQDILGPLPQIPDKRESINWSRRVSAVSGIYEEIDNVNSRRFSQASGIYEEMKPVKDQHFLFQNESPPEVPPRSRINTFENDNFGTIPRSSTNPESIIAASKTKMFLQDLQNSLFGKRKKRSESVSECKVSSSNDFEEINLSTQFKKYESKDFLNHIYQNVPFNYNSSSSNQKNKRNSFSTPDLSKIISLENFLQTQTDLSSVQSSTIDINEMSQSADNVNFRNKTMENEIFSKNVDFNSIDDNTNSQSILNVSDRINDTFNFSINSSTINLVGANFNIKPTDNSPVLVIDEASGYCTMAPIIKSNSKNINLSIYKSNEIMDNFENYRKSSDSDKENFDDACRDCKGKIDIICKSKTMDTGILYEVPKKMESSDEQVPSYPSNYSNCVDVIPVKMSESLNQHIVDNKITAKCNFCHSDILKISENLYVSSPKKYSKQYKKNYEKSNHIKKITPIKACKIAENVYSVKKYGREICSKNENEIYVNSEVFSNSSPIARQTVIDDEEQEYVEPTTISFNKLLQSIDFKFDDTRNMDKIVSNYKLNEKNLTDISSPSKKSYNVNPSDSISKSPIYSKNVNYQNTALTSKTITPEITQAKKLSSLHRLKKMDFSPLKLKINNVLQRNNPEGY